MRAIVVLLVLVLVLPFAAAQRSMQIEPTQEMMVGAGTPQPEPQYTQAAPVAQPEEITQHATPPPPPPARRAARTPTPPQEALTTPVSLYKTTVLCPNVPQTRAIGIVPPGGQNDCDLVGKGKDVDAFLTAMENRAAACKASRAGIWNQVLAAKADFDKQVDALEEPPTEKGLKEIHAVPILCSKYPFAKGSFVLFPPSSGVGNQYYTQWLQDIKRAVTDYCKQVDVPLKLMWKACVGINYEHKSCPWLDDKKRAQYHKDITNQLGVAQEAYDFLTDSLFYDFLQTEGWGGFRKSFNEDAIAKSCPPLIAAQAVRVVRYLQPPQRPWWLFLRRLFSM